MIVNGRRYGIGLILLGWASLMSVAWAAPNITIGELPAGKTVRIVYRATVNNSLADTQLSTQALVTGGNFAAVNSDDPDTTSVFGDANVIGVDRAATTIDIVSSANPVNINTNVTYTATVDAVDNNLDPVSGTVQFFVDGNPEGAAVTLNASGQASITRQFSTTADANITAQFAQTNVYEAANSTTLAQVVNDIPSVSLNNGLTLNEGATATISGSELQTSDTEDSGANLVYTLTSLPTNGTLRLSAATLAVSDTFTQNDIDGGLLSYEHDDTETTDASFMFNVFDSGGAGVTGQVFSFTIIPQNDNSPVVTPSQTFSVDENAINGTIVGSLVATDIDSGTTFQSWSFSNPAFAVNASTGQITVLDGSLLDAETTPSFNISVTVSDSVNTSTPESFTITLNDVNEAPTANNDNYSVDEGNTLNITTAAGVRANDTDPENDTLTITLVSGASNGSLILTPDGSFDYTHDGSETTSDSFTYTASDAEPLTSAVATVNITINPINDVPTLSANSPLSLDEGASATILAGNLTTTDAEDGASALTYTVLALPANGSLQLSAATLAVNDTFTQADINGGLVSYQHDDSETTSDSFNFSVADSDAGSLPGQTFNFTITLLNDNAPVVTPSQSFGLDENSSNGTSVGTILATDSDGDPVTSWSLQPGTTAFAVNASTGEITVADSAQLDFETTPSFSLSVTASDGTNTSVAETVTVTLNDVNETPTANDDSYSVDEGNTLNITLTNGLGLNDSDPENDTLTYAVATTTTNGSLSLNSDGSFDYTHDGSETTSDSFTYSASDGSLTSVPATVTITVNPLNDAPVAVDDSATTDEELAVVIDVLGNDSDAENQLNPAAVLITTAPSNGTTSISSATGAITYTPNIDFNGSETLVYQVSDLDGATSNTATVTITVNNVNDAPVANGDTAGTNEDTAVLIDVLANDTDVDGVGDIDTTSLVVTTQPANGTATVISGQIQYTPAGNFSGNDSFSYTVNDLAAATSNIATVNVSVTSTNDLPQANADTATVDEDGSVVIAVLANDSDIDGTLDASTVTITGTPANGGAVVNTTTGEITYTPDPDFNGTDSLSYQVQDDLAGFSNIATVSITINSLNDAPVANDDTLTLAEDSTQLINVLGNDSDIDNALDVSSVAIISTPANGSASANPATGEISYTPGANFNGSDSLTYQVSDISGATSNIATLTITVTAVNDSPQINEGALLVRAVDEDGSLVVNLTALDADGDTISWSILSSSALGTPTLDNITGTANVFRYTPLADVSGTENIDVEVTDGNGGSFITTMAITVNAINDAPVFTVSGDITVDEDFASQQSVTVTPGPVPTDELSQVVTYSLAPATVSFATVAVNSATGEVTIDAVADASGSQLFTLTANDGQNSNNTHVETFTLTINPVNDAPAFSLSDDLTLQEDFATTETVTVVPNVVPADESDQLVSYSLSPASVAFASIVFDSASGQVTVTSIANASGTQLFTVTADDGQSQNNLASQSFTLTVNAVNDAPVAMADSFNVDEGGTLTITAPGILANDSDIDGPMLGAILGTDVAHGTLTFSPDGAFEYVHDGSENFNDSFTYFANDLALSSAETTVTISINPINDLPVANNDSLTINEEVPTVINVLANDVDSETGFNPATVTVTTLPSNGSVAVNTVNGTITYTPDVNFFGSDSFSYRVEDLDGGLSNIAQVDITVQDVDDNPVAVADSATTAEDTPVVIDVLANDTDPDNGGAATLDTSSVQIQTAPTKGSVSISNGQVTYQPNANETGGDSFTYTVRDLSGLVSAPATVTVNISSSNDAPVATDDSLTTNEDVAAVVNVLANDSDVDGVLLAETVVVLSTPTQGTVTVNPISGEITYTPTANLNGSDSFTYQVEDDLGALSNVATVNVTITPVNDAPIANDDTLLLLENSGQAVNVLGNDSDIDSNLNPASVQVVTGPQNGTAEVNTQTGQITYTPTDFFNGSDSLTYRVADSEGLFSAPATLTITVDAVNQDPEIEQGDSLSLTGDEDNDISQSLNATDVDGDSLSWAILGTPTNGAATLSSSTGNSISVVYTPLADFAGQDSFSIEVSDGNGGMDNISIDITINPVNDAPVFSLTTSQIQVDESFATEEVVAAVAGDVPVDEANQSVGYSLSPTEVSFATIDFDAATGTVRITAVEFESGVETFTLTANDGQASNATHSESFTLIVTPVNNAPVAGADSFEGLPLGGTLESERSLLENDTDIDSENLVAELVDGPANAAEFVLNPDGTFKYVHNGSNELTDSFSYRVFDGEIFSDPIEVVIALNAVNSAPVGQPDSYRVSRGSSIIIAANQGVLANDTDIDNDVLLVQLADKPANGTLLLNGDGSFIYQHNGSFNASDSFSYTLADREFSEGPIEVTIQIQPSNQAPTFSMLDEYFFLTGDNIRIPVNVSDGDGDAVDVDISSNEVPGTVALENGALNFGVITEPGTYKVVLLADDSQESVKHTFTVTITDNSAVTRLTGEWVNAPAEVDRALRLSVVAAQLFGEAVQGQVEVRLTGALRLETAGSNCQPNSATLTFVCSVNLETGFLLNSLMDITPLAAGEIVADIRLLDMQDNELAVSETRIVAAEVAVTESNFTIDMQDVTVLQLGQLFAGGPVELVFGTSEGNVIVIVSVNENGDIAGDFFAIPNQAEQLDIAIGDVTGDAIADLVVVDNLDSNNLTIYQGDGNGGFVTLTNPFTLNSPVTTIELGDFNNDGVMEIVGAYNAGLFYFNVINGEVRLLDGLASNYVSVANLDGDELLDLVTDVDTYLDLIERINGNAVITNAIPRATARALDSQRPLAVISDSTGDKVVFADDEKGVVVSQYDVTSGIYSPLAQVGYFRVTAVTVMHANSDGIPDLVLSNGNEHVLYVATSANYEYRRLNLLVYQSASTLAVSDVNNDATDDFVFFSAIRSEIDVFINDNEQQLGAHIDAAIDASYFVETDRLMVDVSNNGPSDLSNIYVSVAFDAGLALTPPSAYQCIYAQGAEPVWLCVVPALANGQSVELVFGLINRANVDSDVRVAVDSGAWDPLPANNQKQVNISSRQASNKGGGGAMGISLFVLWLAGCVFWHRRSRKESYE